MIHFICLFNINMNMIVSAVLVSHTHKFSSKPSTALGRLQIHFKMAANLAELCFHHKNCKEAMEVVILKLFCYLNRPNARMLLASW